jgi:hypothetical protein
LEPPRLFGTRLQASNLALVKLIKPGYDPILSVEGMGQVRLSELRKRVGNVMANLAEGIYSGDLAAEYYAASSFGVNSELSLLIRALMEARNLK